MKDGNFWDWVLIILAAVAGVAARMGHTWSKRAEEAAATGTVSRGISLAETISAVVTAPALGLIAGGLGDYLGMSNGTIYAMAGFAGLGGPALLFAVWDRIIEPMLTRRG